MSGRHLYRAGRKHAIITEGPFRGMTVRAFQQMEKMKRSRRQAWDHADRLCARVVRALKEIRQAAGLKPYALWQWTGVSRDMISCMERGKVMPGMHVIGRLLYGTRAGMTELARRVERMRERR
jgi:ribosome-binding protein aMBF1 (putative translation factor)